eukprot:TRINITY_DN13090_c0_g1_i1.p1 TRINITY_DN13090_c0_g1~~TRINITY_DN13090_c0_g1_i1.p1  ORF type:complete len:271 (+),score=84.05 TRINITY_DN13090_c0_g1_i1:483-1295(+)
MRGDLTKVKCDAIVNAANSRLSGGGGVDGKVHAAAGHNLTAALLGQRCRPGNCVATRGFQLPARHVLHAVAPVAKGDAVLRSCYTSCLAKCRELSLQSLTFCCLGTGIFRFPRVRAAHIALAACRQWLEADVAGEKQLQRLVFCVYDETDYEVYQRLLRWYFPREGDEPDELIARFVSAESAAAALPPLPRAGEILSDEDEEQQAVTEQEEKKANMAAVRNECLMRLDSDGTPLPSSPPTPPTPQPGAAPEEAAGAEPEATCHVRDCCAL